MFFLVEMQITALVRAHAKNVDCLYSNWALEMDRPGRLSHFLLSLLIRDQISEVWSCFLLAFAIRIQGEQLSAEHIGLIHVVPYIDALRPGNRLQ